MIWDTCSNPLAYEDDIMAYPDEQPEEDEELRREVEREEAEYISQQIQAEIAEEQRMLSEPNVPGWW